MKQALFGSIRPGAMEKLLGAVEKRDPVALSGLPESMAAFMAAKLAEETGKRVLLLGLNDLRATHDADDGQQLLGTQAAFMPGGEIDLCGHATLATAFVILSFYEQGADAVRFITRSGELTVTKRGELLEMDFPAYELKSTEVTEEMSIALGAKPKEAWLGRDLLCVFEGEETVRSMIPDMEKLLSIPGLLVHVTAKGSDTDCVSRSFGPKLAIPEDPVCGSGHCHIVPYWADTLGKEELVAYQASRRGGTLYCRRNGDRISLSGRAVLFSEAELHIG